MEVLPEVFICGRSFLKWEFLLCFSQWFCVIAFFGYRKIICFSFGIRFEISVVSCSNISPNNYISVFIYSHAYFSKPLWLFFHKRRLAECWCCWFYIMNSYGDHMLSTSRKDHGRRLYDFISKSWGTDWSCCWSRPSSIHKNKVSLLASVVSWRTFIPFFIP